MKEGGMFIVIATLQLCVYDHFPVYARYIDVALKSIISAINLYSIPHIV